MFLLQMTIYVIYGTFIICAYGKHHGLFLFRFHMFLLQMTAAYIFMYMEIYEMHKYDIFLHLHTFCSGFVCFTSSNNIFHTCKYIICTYMTCPCGKHHALFVQRMQNLFLAS